MTRNPAMKPIITLENILSKITTELQLAMDTKQHVFRYPVLATCLELQPKQRTVVLREVSNSLGLRCYTDYRSAKVAQLQANAHASLLFYDPVQKLQISMEGSMTIIHNEQETHTIWDTIATHAKNDYTTTTAPGSSIDTPDAISYLDTTHHLTILDLTPIHIEYLQLTRTKHIRAAFDKINGKWEGKFLTP